ncbi:MAG: polyphosphate kinase 1 [Acidobacteria bacterium]|nr:polyphosphate kinase 1 [Acidobacteriota bacterium]
MDEQPSTNPPDDAPAVAVQEAGIDSVWINRDLSWLAFNQRVLAEALDERTPLLERVKFLAIFSANLDEFFMKRMAVLRENQGGHRTQLLEQMRKVLEPMLHQQSEYFTGELVPALSRRGIHLKRWDELTDSQRREAGVLFDTQVSAALTPIVIHPTQPFPFFSNLSLSVAFVLHDDSAGHTVDARVKVPAELRQWVRLSADVAAGEQLYTPLHELVRENAYKLYPGMRLSAPTLFRVTRDAEVELDEDEEQSMRELVREQIRQRRYEPVVRLEFAANADPRLRQLLQQRFDLADRDVYELPGETDYTSLFEIAALECPDLHDTPWTPVVPKRLETDESIFETLRRGDLLVHHPYESFDESVEQFISAAADDPGTLAIKMTVYRVGDDTPFVRSLIRAAEAGKQVACVIELKARFDEKRNLHWAGELERAGAHVTVSGTKLKTHAKVALVVRQEPSGVRSYAHIGTGNYHVRTARLYTDIGLLTCDPSLTADISKLFHHLTGRSKSLDFETLLVAPGGMRQRFVELIAREAANQRAGRPARIIAQMNQLEDPAIIAALCDASRAGVSIDLIVRGLCCLRPGVEGVSDTIRVRSVIGRFLEHSRIFYFAAGSHDPLDGDFLIGSADWMYRNLSRRVEVAAPVTAREGRARLWEILELLLSDQRQAWQMNSDGVYVQLRPPIDTEERSGTDGTHQTLIERTQSRLSREYADDVG